MKFNNLRTIRSKNFTIVTLLSFLLIQSCHKTDALKPNESLNTHNSITSSSALAKPNIIIILGDDIGYYVPTVNGGESFETPNIDKMAARGMRFTRCYSSPLCAPSRFTLLTGKYNFRNYTEWGVMNPNEKTFGTLLRTAGYETFIAGKWGFDGGDTSIRSLGFPKYSVFNPFKNDPVGSRYKNPHIYQNGAYLPAADMEGKYGDDIFTENVLSFVKQNRKKNFFVYFPITLCHYPYSPTPDDPEFAKWGEKGSTPEARYFPSMVKYMDKKIGQVVDSLKAWNLYDNTILMFMGDNGTPHHIFYTTGGVEYEGEKSESTEGGTHVPLIVTWPKQIEAGQVNNHLIDFTDFLPTLADAAGISVPRKYGTIDGYSFYNQLTGNAYTPRQWVFCHYEPGTEGGNTYKRWIQDTTYKLYDITGAFYNTVTDPYEKSPILPEYMTPYQRTVSTRFQRIMDSLHL